MTSEERNEKNRVEKRLLNAKAMLDRLNPATHTYRRMVVIRRIQRIESTLRGYD